MGVMKKNLLLVMALFTIASLQSNASMTVEQMTEPDYIINNGYSEATAEEILLVKNRVNGKPAETANLKNRSSFVRFCRNIFGYIDPANTLAILKHPVHSGNL